MNMGDVFAFFGALLAVGIALPGMLLAWSLIFPGIVERARLRLQCTPWRCFLLGIVWLVASVPPIAILLNIPSGPVQFVGWVGIIALLTFASLGAAGLALLMGDRLRCAGLAVSPAGALVRGALALELAAIFPVIGWFIVIPLAIICALGAAGFGLLGWGPRSTSAPAIAADQRSATGHQPSAGPV